MSRGPTTAMSPELRAKIPALVKELGARTTSERTGVSLRLVRQIARVATEAKTPAAGRAP